LRKKIPYLIIPIFIPFGGCSHQCVFCNQTKITGSTYLPGEREIAGTVESHLSTWKKGGRKEIAFYGGSFTSLPEDVQENYLKTAYKYVKTGQVDGIRLSTRPDAIDDNTIRLLKKYRVGAVELGVQSMVNSVLKLSGRGHMGKDTVRAAALLKEANMLVGMQIMPGLPGDTEATIVNTARRVIITRPNFVRIYPTVVIRDTPLHNMYKKGDYIPWTLDEMVSICRRIYEMFQRSSITVIRMGLQPTVELEKNIVAGPYHPSFRQLVEGTHIQSA
jgi:histone acetyltransferase (RNA polymerase elongator complex component)